jgi:hypothetical protein
MKTKFFTALVTMCCAPAAFASDVPTLVPEAGTAGSVAAVAAVAAVGAIAWERRRRNHKD